MIIDNLDDLDSFDLFRILPQETHKNVLITSRRPECARLGFGIAITQMNQEEALALLFKCLSRNEPDPNDQGNLPCFRLLGR